MPEGHTIHRAARDHAEAFAGQALRISSPQDRFDCARLLGKAERLTLRRVEAHGKHLFYVFARGRTVHVHLGLFGRFYRRKNPAPPPRDTTRLRLEGELLTLDLVGPTACELLTPMAKAALLARLGPDPLRADGSARRFRAILAKARTAIGALLLDQSAVAGVGNVYRAELLHLMKLHPATPARDLSAAEATQLWKLMGALLRRGVEERRIVTTQGTGGALPKKRIPRGEALHVYRRRRCFTCGGPVTWSIQRARTLYFCPACQPARSTPSES